MVAGQPSGTGRAAQQGPVAGRRRYRRPATLQGAREPRPGKCPFLPFCPGPGSASHRAGTAASGKGHWAPKSAGRGSRGGARGPGLGSRVPGADLSCREAALIPGPARASGLREGAPDPAAPAPLPGKFQV